MNQRFWSAVFLLSGTTVGAGILGLPYAFSQGGFFVGVFWLLSLGLLTLVVNLVLGELTLRVPGTHQLSGLAEKFGGLWARRVMLFAVLFGGYAALLAYLVGEGESLFLLFGSHGSPLLFGVLFWCLMTSVLRGGIRRLKKVETWGELAVIIIIGLSFLWFLPRLSWSNLLVVPSSHVMAPFGVVLFALLGYSSLPEIREVVRGHERLLKKVIIMGTLLPIALYLLFTAFVLGVLGGSVSEVASLSFGPVLTLLGMFTMMTSYVALSFALRDTFTFDVRVSSRMNFFFSSLLPLALYVVVTVFGIVSFSSLLGIGGTISGGVSVILILWLAYKAQRSSTPRSPEFMVPLNKWFIIVLSLVLLLGTVFEFL